MSHCIVALLKYIRIFDHIFIVCLMNFQKETVGLAVCDARALQNRASAGGAFFAHQRALQNRASTGSKFAMPRANGIQRVQSPV
jgi:hypothetical protein